MIQEELVGIMISLPVFVEKLVALQEQRGSTKTQGLRTLTRALEREGLGSEKERLRLHTASSSREAVTRRKALSSCRRHWAAAALT